MSTKDKGMSWLRGMDTKGTAGTTAPEARVVGGMLGSYARASGEEATVTGEAGEAGDDEAVAALAT